MTKSRPDGFLIGSVFKEGINSYVPWFAAIGSLSSTKRPNILHVSPAGIFKDSVAGDGSFWQVSDVSADILKIIKGYKKGKEKLKKDTEGNGKTKKDNEQEKQEKIKYN